MKQLHADKLEEMKWMYDTQLDNIQDFEEKIEDERLAHMDKELDIISLIYESGNSRWTSVIRVMKSFLVTLVAIIAIYCYAVYTGEHQNQGQN